jgi:hypothetical protein
VAAIAALELARARHGARARKSAREEARVAQAAAWEAWEEARVVRAEKARRSAWRRFRRGEKGALEPLWQRVVRKYRVKSWLGEKEDRIENLAEAAEDKLLGRTNA